MAKLKVGDIYPTNNSGDLEILEYRSCNNVLVKFLDTGEVRRTVSASIKIGMVKDKSLNGRWKIKKDKPKRRLKVNVGDIFKSELYGEYEVIKRLLGGKGDGPKYDISFLETGTIKSYWSTAIQIGKVTDKASTNYVDIRATRANRLNKGSIELEYPVWKSMLNRASSTEGTYKDVRVCSEWLNYSVFRDWLRATIYSTSNDLQLDKDYLSDNDNKIYSPDTCSIIPSKVNVLRTSGVKFSKTSTLPLGVWKEVSKKGQVVYKTNVVSVDGKRQKVGSGSPMKTHTKFQHLTSDKMLKLLKVYPDLDTRVSECIEVAALNIMKDLAQGFETKQIWGRC